MKKVAIITLNGYFNYGNRLQNYALQEIISSLGFKVQTIRFNRYKKMEIHRRPFLIEIKKWITNPIAYAIDKKRQDVFLNFSHKYILETNESFFMDDDLSQLNSSFDYFVVGSDQVWNPSMNMLSPFFFLEFADVSKRIAYAPSFGISSLTKEVSVKYRNSLHNIPYLSVREDEGAKIIKDITGRSVDVVVDPTFLLTKEKWSEISKPAPNKPSEKYLLTYFLGEIPIEYSEQINELAELKKLTIINLGDISDKDSYQTGPSEFIDYIKDCSLFCTDSFHGTVFSILFEKPFIVYERKSSISMYSRIDTLLKKFKLLDRKSNIVEINIEAFELEFIHTLPIINRERVEALKFLRSSLRL